MTILKSITNGSYVDWIGSTSMSQVYVSGEAYLGKIVIPRWL